MNNFLDLVGASGAAYRFRKVDSALSSVGGNFVYARDEDGGPRIVCCGSARSLGWALSKPIWLNDENSQPDDVLYIRLNAIAAIRKKEHEDLVDGLARPFTIYEIE